MKFKHWMFFAIAAVLVVYAAIPASSETIRMSGSTVNLEILSTAAATDIGDTLATVHQETQALQSTADGIGDTLTTTHSRLETMKKATADTLTKVSTDTGITRTKATAIGDTLTKVSTDTGVINTATAALKDTLTATHADLAGREKAIADTLTNAHTAVVAVDGKVTAAQDTLTKISTDTGVINTAVAASADTLTKISTDTGVIDGIIDKIAGVTGVLYEQADVAVSLNASADADSTVFDLNTASTRYVVRNLVLKCADPGANTVTVSLEMLVNDVATVVDTFAITTSNYATYFKLVDLFGCDELAGDDIRVFIRASADGPYAVTGQYSYAKTNN